MTATQAHYDRIKATLGLDAPVTSVDMVSAARANMLRKLNIASVRDLLTNFPRRYIDMSQVETIAQAPCGRACTIKGRVYEVKLKKPKPRLALTEVTITDETGTLIVTAFRQPWLAEQLKAGMTVALSGKVEFNYGYKRMTNPYIEPLEDDSALLTGVILPVHPLTAGIKAGLMRRLVANALEAQRGTLDPLPLSLRLKYRLMSRQNALSCIHFPRTMDEQVQARRRLAYEEVLLLELSLMRETAHRGAGAHAFAHMVDGPVLAALTQQLPFALTAEQKSACSDILGHMAADTLMNHMLLGDVGTGKTIVAAFAVAAAVDTGTQTLFMAPTEMLAAQHAQSIGTLLEQAGASTALLTGSTSREQRARIKEDMAAGTLDVLFGTHALLEDDIEPARCSLVIIDEQQRFGVEQRERLLRKAPGADELYLTATPIPRTLARALFGDMTLSYIKERPFESAHRTTKVLKPDEKGIAFDAARAALARGEQVYVVCPLVGVKPPRREKEDASEGQAAPDVASGTKHATGAGGAGGAASKTAAVSAGGLQDVSGDAQSVFDVIQIEDARDMNCASLTAAQSEADFLQRKVFTDSKVGLLHGKMSAADKAQVMDEFRSSEVQVLVATTIVEVGVDVPNATVMIVQDADRFGLSQLHQLRGRVGRGQHPGEVFLISGNRSALAVSRLAAMESTEDGFELASYDLSLRREGDILGNRQHGASMLKLVNVTRDEGLIEAAWSDARTIMDEDPLLESDAYKPLAREMALTLKEDACES